MLKELAARISLSPVDLSIIREISEQTRFRMVIDDTQVNAIQDGNIIVLGFPESDQEYEVESAASAASLIFSKTGHQSSIPRLARDRLQAVADAVRHGRFSTATTILEVTDIPEDSYEVVFHILKTGMKIGEEFLLKELDLGTNSGKAFPYPTGEHAAY
jgi:hypothetical protein